jgi:broad-specificity NMP kinase
MEENMNKKLIVVNGAPGVGKTTTCRIMHQHLNRSVWLDGDWCWMANPWIVTNETKQIVEKNIAFVLNSFLGCSEYRYVLFSWILRTDELLNDILSQLMLSHNEVYKFTLTCDKAIYRTRLITHGTDPHKMDMCLKSLHLCQLTDSIKVNTSDNSAEKAARIIIDYL